MTYCKWKTDQPKSDGFVCQECGTWRRAKVRRICQTDEAQQRAIAAGRQERERNKPKRIGSRPVVVKPVGRSLGLISTRTFRRRCVLLTRWLRAIGRWAWQSAKHRRWMVRSEAEYLRVKAICQACPFNQWDADNEACKVCGCGGRSKVVLLNKLKIETEKCPKGAW